MNKTKIEWVKKTNIQYDEIIFRVLKIDKPYVVVRVEAAKDGGILAVNLPKEVKHTKG